MEPRHMSAIEDIKKDLIQKDHVKGILLYGSLSKGDYHSNSDIDLMVIGEHEKHRTECFYKNGIAVQMIWRTPSLFTQKIMKRTRMTPISTSFKILYDAEGFIEHSIEKSKTVVNEGPVPLSDHEFKMHIGTLSSEFDTIVGLAKKGEQAAMILLANQMVMSGIELYYDHHQLFLESPKHIIREFKKHNITLGTLAESILIESRAKEKINDLSLFRDEILKLKGGPLEKYELYWT